MLSKAQATVKLWETFTIFIEKRILAKNAPEKKRALKTKCGQLSTETLKHVEIFNCSGLVSTTKCSSL